MKKKSTSSRKRLSLTKSTLRHLRPDQLRRIGGGDQERPELESPDSGITFLGCGTN